VSLLRPAQDASAADWIVESLTTFAESVVSLVPEGFEAYVRVFHPAQRDGRPLRWAEIAAEHGRTAHAGMQLGGITGKLRNERHNGRSDVWDRPPDEGMLPPGVAAALTDVLSRQTKTPEHCWFAAWEGFGALRDDVRAAPKFEVPGRRYHLLIGPASAAGEQVLNPPWKQTSNLWWPDDHAWCVATEIDLRSTYVGCSQACADELVAHPELEAYAIDPGAGIAWASDTVNPEPARG